MSSTELNKQDWTWKFWKLLYFLLKRKLFCVVGTCLLSPTFLSTNFWAFICCCFFWTTFFSDLGMYPLDLFPRGSSERWTCQTVRGARHMKTFNLFFNWHSSCFVGIKQNKIKTLFFMKRKRGKTVSESWLQSRVFLAIQKYKMSKRL